MERVGGWCGFCRDDRCFRGVFMCMSLLVKVEEAEGTCFQ